MIILGQNNYAKAAVFNELLHRDILPTEAGDDVGLWRLVNLHLGSTNSALLCEKKNPPGPGRISGTNREKLAHDPVRTVR